jgi:hypothetical protein
MVDIYVGPENTHWILHEKLLYHHSPYFATLLLLQHQLPDDKTLPSKAFFGWLAMLLQCVCSVVAIGAGFLSLGVYDLCIPNSLVNLPPAEAG